MAEVLNGHLKLPPVIYRRYSPFIGESQFNVNQNEPGGSFENLRNGVEGGIFSLFCCLLFVEL